MGLDFPGLLCRSHSRFGRGHRRGDWKAVNDGRASIDLRNVIL
jgi:hypothetical protein